MNMPRQKPIATEHEGQLYVSWDNGQSWTPVTESQQLQQQIQSTGPYPGKPTPNAFANRFAVLGDPVLRSLYEAHARRIGEEFNENSVLNPLVVGPQNGNELQTDTASDPGVPIILNADRPTVNYQYYFQDPAFVRRVTAVVVGAVPTANAQSLDGQCEFDNRALNYIWVQMRRAGDSDVFQTAPVTLAEAAGAGVDTYFFSLIPVMRRASTLIVTFSLIPPGWPTSQDPPFVRRVGSISMNFATERWAPFGT